MRRRERNLRAWLLGLALGLSLTLAACQQGDPRGTYEVAIVIDSAGRPIDGVLVIGASMLELDVMATDLIVAAKPNGGDGFVDEDDLLTNVNSCLAIASLDPTDPRPRSVRFFDVRIRGREVDVPFPVFEGGDQRIEVTKLQFVANTLGGDIRFQEGDVTLKGRIFGDRTGAAESENCMEQLRQYEERILEQIQGAAAASAGKGKEAASRARSGLPN